MTDTAEMASDTTDVTVRPAVIEDDAGLLAVEQAAWTSQSGFPSFRDPDRTEFFNNDRLGVDAHFVAEYGGRIVGYIRLAPVTLRPEDAHVLGIPGLAVAPAARRRSVAAALLRFVEAEGRRRGAHKLALQVLHTNESAFRLYERHGYVVEGRLRDNHLIEGNYVDSIVMARFLID